MFATSSKRRAARWATQASVAFMFQTKGQIIIDASKYDEDTIMDKALEAGADDVQAPEGADEENQGVWTSA